MPIWLVKLLPYAIAIALALGAIWYIYHEGQVDERNSTNSKVLVESESQRKEREKTDVRIRGLPDADATKCLRSTAGC